MVLWGHKTEYWKQRLFEKRGVCGQCIFNIVLCVISQHPLGFKWPHSNELKEKRECIGSCHCKVQEFSWLCHSWFQGRKWYHHGPLWPSSLPFPSLCGLPSLTAFVDKCFPWVVDKMAVGILDSHINLATPVEMLWFLSASACHSQGGSLIGLA